MDFARKQLEKYGWSDGKGLGKHENGISEALKPKLKRSVTGIGYDAAADFTEHWWSALYDKAAGNVQVEEENGKTKKMKRKDDKEFEITNSTWRLKKKNNSNNTEEYSDFFVRTAVLGSGGSKTTKVKDSDSEDETTGGDVARLTDEELFAACQGRTAHKGARHGLRALGKLARIEQQEQLLLQQSKYNNFLAKNKPANNEQVVEDTSLVDVNVNKKKKKKKKRCNSNENEYNDNIIKDNVSEESNDRISNEMFNKSDHIVASEENIQKKSKKSKKKEVGNKIKDSSEIKNNIEVSNDVEYESVLKSKKKRKHTNIDLDEDIHKTDTEVQEIETKKFKKKKKK